MGREQRYGEFDARNFTEKTSVERAVALLRLTQHHHYLRNHLSSLGFPDERECRVVDIGGSYTFPLYIPQNADVVVVDPVLDQQAGAMALAEITQDDFVEAVQLLPDSQKQSMTNRDGILDLLSQSVAEVLEKRGIASSSSEFADAIRGGDGYDNRGITFTPTSLHNQSQSASGVMENSLVIKQNFLDVLPDEIGGNFDIVIMSQTLGYVPIEQRKRALRNIRQLLSPTGRFVAAEISPVRKRGRNITRNNMRDPDFSVRETMKKLRSSGFKVSEPEWRGYDNDYDWVAITAVSR